MELLKLLNANELVAQIISFLMLLWILRVFLWKRFLKIIDDRRDRIASEFEKINALQAEAQKARALYDEKLDVIDELVRERLQEAVAEGKRIAQEIKDKAEKDGERMLQTAKENIKIELAKAKEELKDRIVDLTIAVAEKVIEEKLSEADEKRMVADFLKGIESK